MLLLGHSQIEFVGKNLQNADFAILILARNHVMPPSGTYPVLCAYSIFRQKYDFFVFFSKNILDF